jgi:hypothetical protein
MALQKNIGSIVNLTMSITNTGNTTCTFYCGNSLKSPSGVVIDNPIQTVSLAPNASSSRSWSDNVPSSWEAGSWLVRFSVWNSDPGVDASASRLADTNWITGFQVVAPTVCSAIITGTTVA